MKMFWKSVAVKLTFLDGIIPDAVYTKAGG